MLLQALCIISKPWVNSNWSYSPETLNSGQNWQFFVPCDLEIWRITLKNNRAPLLCCYKLCASFHSHQWIQTRVTVRNCAQFGSKSMFLAATKQLYDWFSPSVCPPVTPFSPCSHHRIIMKFSGVITMVRSDVNAKGQGKRSKVKVTEVNTQLSRFRTLTPVWIHIWQWNHAHSWKQHRRGALFFFKVIRQISRSHGSKNRRIWPRLGISGL